MTTGVLGKLRAGAGAVLFPPVCPGCGSETGMADTLCRSCWSETEFIAGPVCDGCGRPVEGLAHTEPGFHCDACRRDPPLWRRGRGALVYRGTGRRLVLGLKHGDRLDTVPMLAQWLRRSAGPLVDEADLIAPVPLHWTRRVRRRFNQSAELARALARAAGRPGAYAGDALRRIRRTASQDGRNREERNENVIGAFGPGTDSVDGLHVLLVDDVMTTGATLNAAADALLAAGAASVDVLVIALVPPGVSPYIDPEVPEGPQPRAASPQ